MQHSAWCGRTRTHTRSFRKINFILKTYYYTRNKFAEPDAYLQVCLDGITNLLAGATKMGQLEAMCCAVEACGGVDAIENLQQHENESVYAMAQQLIDEYFSAEVTCYAMLVATTDFYSRLCHRMKKEASRLTPAEAEATFNSAKALHPAVASVFDHSSLFSIVLSLSCASTLAVI